MVLSTLSLLALLNWGGWGLPSTEGVVAGGQTWIHQRLVGVSRLPCAWAPSKALCACGHVVTSVRMGTFTKGRYFNHNWLSPLTVSFEFAFSHISPHVGESDHRHF